MSRIFLLLHGFSTHWIYTNEAEWNDIPGLLCGSNFTRETCKRVLQDARLRMMFARSRTQRCCLHARAATLNGGCVRFTRIN